MPKNSVFNYVSREVYESSIKDLKDGEIKNIYSINGVQIDVKKVGKKIYKFINLYGDKKVEVCLKNMYKHRNISFTV